VLRDFTVQELFLAVLSVQKQEFQTQLRINLALCVSRVNTVVWVALNQHNVTRASFAKTTGCHKLAVNVAVDIIVQVLEQLLPIRTCAQPVATAHLVQLLPLHVRLVLMVPVKGLLMLLLASHVHLVFTAQLQDWLLYLAQPQTTVPPVIIAIQHLRQLRPYLAARAICVQQVLDIKLSVQLDIINQ
jgi:hypothetical protein